MNNITRITDKYNDMNIDDILSHPDLARDIAHITKSTEDIDPKTKIFLEKLLQEIGKKSSEMASIMQEIKINIEKRTEIAKANIAYLKNK